MPNEGVDVGGEDGGCRQQARVSGWHGSAGDGSHGDNENSGGGKMQKDNGQRHGSLSSLIGQVPVWSIRGNIIMFKVTEIWVLLLLSDLWIIWIVLLKAHRVWKPLFAR